MWRGRFRRPGLALVLGEIRKSAGNLTGAEDAQPREKLQLWKEHDLHEWFGVRILPIGPEVANHWGRLLAATALYNDLRLVTRAIAETLTPVGPERRGGKWASE